MTKLPDVTHSYGQISSSKHVNDLIYRCFQYLHDDDKLKFVKKFKKHDQNQAMHTVRELLFGAYLNSCGLKVRFEHNIELYNPDWCLLDENFSVVGIFELVNFHIDKVTEDQITEQLKAKSIAVYWQDGNKNNVDRLYSSIQEKAIKYKELLERTMIPYVIALFIDLRVQIDFKEDLLPCLFDNETGIFEKYPTVSAVQLIEDRSNGQYAFSYVLNPKAISTLPIGIFPQNPA